MNSCVGHGVHHLMASMGSDVIPLANVYVPSDVYTHSTLPGVFTHLQWMPQWMSTVEVITSC